MVPGVVGGFNDDAIYAVTAISLADGEGYRLHNFPGSPRQTKYPILYPALMAIASNTAATLPGRLAAMQWATLAISAVALALWYAYLVRFAYCGRTAAFAACFLCASAPNFVYYSSAVLSEMPFTLLLVGALWAVERLRGSPEPSSPWQEFLVGVLVGLPALCRVVGGVLPVVVVLLLALERRRLIVVGMGSAVVIFPWLVWVGAAMGQSVADPLVGYQTDYLAWLWWSDLSFSWTVLSSNAAALLRAFTHISYEGIARLVYQVTDSEPLLALLGGLVGFVPLMRRCRRPSLAAWFSVVYLGLILLYPWPPDRFLIPMLPFLVALFYQSLFQVALPLGRYAASGLVGALLVVGVLTNGWVLAEHASTKAEFGYPFFIPTEAPVAWRSYQEAFRWLDAHAGLEDVLVAGLDTMTALYTSRPTVRTYVPNPAAVHYGSAALPVGSVEQFGALLELHRPRYVLQAPMPSYAEEIAQYKLVRDFADRYPSRLRLAWRGSDPFFEIYAFVPQGSH